MFDQPYPYISLGSQTTYDGYPEIRYTYRFVARHRTYLVYLEKYKEGIVAVKYFDRRDKKRPDQFKRIFNEKESDAGRILATCLQIMRDFWYKSPSVNFAFEAVMRVEIPDHVAERRKFDENPLRRAAYVRSRFNIYHYAMLNLFSPDHFDHNCDYHHAVYLLLNKLEKDKEKVVASIKSLLETSHNGLNFEAIQIG